MMLRFLFSLLLALALLAAGGTARAATLEALWKNFKQDFISADGRVIDWQNNQISHSEGQGFGLLLAVEMNDKEAFERLLTWSDNNLGEGLRAWSWGKLGEQWGVLDTNNATDGDILHAWALLLAGERWGNAAWIQAGMDIVVVIRNELIDPHGYLLPARMGFQFPDKTRLNLAYYVFPAFRYFAAAEPHYARLWKEIHAKGLDLYQKSLANAAVLPPDWLYVGPDGQPLPPQGPEAIYGFEAISIPLYLAWDGNTRALEALRPFLSRVARQGWMPQAIDLLTPVWSNVSGSPEGGIGHYAVLARAATTLGMREEAKKLWMLADQMRVKHQGNYYGEVLYLLARVL